MDTSLTSTCKSNFSQYFEQQNFRNISVPSKPNRKEETVTLNFIEPGQMMDHVYLSRKKTDDGEIGVFGAEKYFNGVMNEKNARIVETPMKQQHKEERACPEPVKPKTVSETKSIHSESSWNSQGALLQSVLRNTSQSKTNKVQRKRFLANLGCNCSCSDKNSVGIDETVGDNNLHKVTTTKEPVKTTLKPDDSIQTNKIRPESWTKEGMQHPKSGNLGTGLNREDCFRLSLPNFKPGNMTVKKQLKKEEGEKGRKSLEVFGSSLQEKGNMLLSFERRLNMFNWEAAQKVEEIEIPATCNGLYNDSESDASSDLFEIESLSGKLNQFLNQQASDGASGCVTPATCYAPSEASIEWSVVTASAADFSVVSDTEEQKAAAKTINLDKNTLPTITTSKNTSKEVHRRRPGIFLGCKSQKAVSVAGNANRTSERANSVTSRHHRTESFMPESTFKAETRITCFDSRHEQQHDFAMRRLADSHPARASRLMYIK